MFDDKDYKEGRSGKGKQYSDRKLIWGEEGPGQQVAKKEESSAEYS